MAQAIELKPICKYEYDKTTKDLFLVSPEGQGVYYKINDLKKIFPLDVKKYNAIVFPSYGDHGFIDFEGVDLSDFQISGKLCSINFINGRRAVHYNHVIIISYRMNNIFNHIFKIRCRLG